MPDWHQKEAADVAAEFSTPLDRGLSADEVGRRQAESGPNELAEAPSRSVGRILWQQFSGPLILLLVAAAILSFFLAEYIDGAAILAIVVLNAALGFHQDYRAERAMTSLRRLAAPNVRVRRGGAVLEVPSRELVPGDIVLLESGNRVPADGRIVTTAGLQVEEAVLTGESEAVEKAVAPIAQASVPLGDRRNMAFMGTVVRSGRGEALITETGMATELGKISGMLQAIPPEKTPLQRKLARLAIVLTVFALGCVGIVFAIGMVQGTELSTVFMTGLSLAVAVVPEGLPAVATVTLALGSMRLYRRHALIRELPAVETLGSITVICADKTGTITENVMTLDRIETLNDQLMVQHGDEGEPSLSRTADQAVESIDAHPDAALLLVCGALCNDAALHKESGAWSCVGDPTECALLTAAAAFGCDRPSLEALLPRVDEVPFDSERKRMSTLHEAADDRGALPPLASAALGAFSDNTSTPYILFAKGAVASILEHCSNSLRNGEIAALTDEARSEAVALHDAMAGAGRRVLAFAFRALDERPPSDRLEDFEDELTFIGLAGLHDPPRPEAADAVRQCVDAGIRPIMITGDHRLTAESIASEVGIESDGPAVTGEELEDASDEALQRMVESTSVYARVSPRHKLRIVEALKASGAVVCMTGDGANDAPALKQADIGVAMGITGTDVARDAAEMVLLDDNFATIVNAVQEGRRIYDNIRKFLRYTMTSNAGEVGVMLAAPLLGMPLPLLPLQILWVNLVTDGLPGLALSLEPVEKDAMRRPPHAPNAPILDKTMAWDILWIGALMSAVSLGAGYAYWRAGPTEVYDASWGTIVFTVLTLSQLGNALAIRSRRESFFTLGVFTNWPLLVTIVVTVGLQLAVVYTPPLQTVFKTQPLGVRDLSICLALSTIVFCGVEVSKWVGRRLRTGG